MIRREPGAQDEADGAHKTTEGPSFHLPPSVSEDAGVVIMVAQVRRNDLSPSALINYEEHFCCIGSGSLFPTQRV